MNGLFWKDRVFSSFISKRLKGNRAILMSKKLTPWSMFFIRNKVQITG